MPVPSRVPWLPVLAALALVPAVVLELAAPAAAAGRDLAPGPVWAHVLLTVATAVLADALRRTDRRRGARLLALVAATGVVAATTRAGVHAWVVDLPSSLTPGLSALLWAAKATTLVPFLAVAYLLVLFPDGRPVTGRWGRLGVAALVASSVSFLCQVLGPTTVAVQPVAGDPAGGVLRGDHVLTTPALDALVGPIAPPVAVVTVASFVLLLLPQAVVRYARAGLAEREAHAWVLWAVAVTALVAIADAVLHGGVVSPSLTLVWSVLILLAMATALTPQSRVSGSTLLSRTLVYGGVGVVVLVLDLAVLSVLTEVLQDRLGGLGERDVVLVVLLLSALLYNPLRSAISDRVHRLVLGERDDPYDVVAGLAASLEGAEGAQQLDAVARVVAQAFGIGYVAVQVDRGEGETGTGSWGHRPVEVRRLPITYRDEQVGHLVLPLRGVRARLSPRDQRLLGDLVRQAAVAARTGRLAEELQVNRQRLVVAREEERRRIRHDLHEDLGPTLGGLVHQVEAARLLVREHPEEAKETIARTSRHLRDVVADVRRVVHDLRPPALDDRGLVGALRQQAELASGDTVEVSVEGERIDDLPAAVEVAAFRIVSEALVGVLGAGARRCVVRLHRAERELVVELDADVAPEVGPMHARALELGGRAEATVPAGSGVRVRLPVREAS
nr:histidine kinase [Nocardioides flavescens]